MTTTFSAPSAPATYAPIAGPTSCPCFARCATAADSIPNITRARGACTASNGGGLSHDPIRVRRLFRAVEGPSVQARRQRHAADLKGGRRRMARIRSEKAPTRIRSRTDGRLRPLPPPGSRGARGPAKRPSRRTPGRIRAATVPRKGRLGAGSYRDQTTRPRHPAPDRRPRQSRLQPRDPAA